MLKIQAKEFDDRVVLEVEGRLAGAVVTELATAWKTADERQPGRKVVVDLKDLTCVDRGGRHLLQTMYGKGVEFVRAGIATQDILEEIREQRGCGQ